MKKQYLVFFATAAAVTLTLAACGGGSGGTSANLSTGATTQGVITGFGSVFVDGIEYAIPSGTPISMDGNNATESELQVGMLVTIKGNVNPDGKTGTASSIEYTDQMEGVVTANTVAANGTGTLTVMGQTINVTADTIFDSKVASITSPDLIQVGNIVEISGYASSTGVVTATRIEVKASSQAAGAVIEVKGIISNLDTTNGTFTLGSLSVDYNALPAAYLPSTALVNGQYVEVKSTTPFDGTGALIASKIELTDDGVKGHEGTLGEALEIKGLVTADYANNQFELNGRTILVNSSTRIENGTTAQLLTGTPVKVHSHFDSNGTLVADKIDFKNATKTELEGTLQAVDLTAGTITLLDQVIYVDSNTVLLDKSDAAVRYFSLADLNPINGDHLEVNAYLDAATGHLIATKLERKNFSNEAKITGSIDSSAGLQIAGIAIDTSTATGAVPVLGSGEQAEVTGIYSNGKLYASKISVGH
jgi:hypothetical protein